MRLAVAAALAVAAGCAALLVAGRLGAVRSPSSASADCGAACAPRTAGGPATAGPGPARTDASVTTGPMGPTGRTASIGQTGQTAPTGPVASTGPTAATRPTAPEQHRSRSLPASSAAPPAAASSAPVSASALVQFKVTSHWGDGYRADVTVTNTGTEPMTGWHLTFQVTGATLHQPTDTGETAMSGDVVTITPAGWRPVLTAGAAATFGFGFDGTLAALPSRREAVRTEVCARGGRPVIPSRGRDEP